MPATNNTASPLLGTPPEEFDPNSLSFNDPAVTRKVAIVTGGNSGLGYFTALHLYTHGYVVYIAARNPTKAADAIAKIKEEVTKRKSTLPVSAVLGELRFLKLDLASLAQTQESVEDFLEKETQLDLLVNNAGVTGLPAEQTEDKLEIQIQTNHISPFLFTIKLIPLLQKSAYGPRIVFVSSALHNLSDNPKDFGKVRRFIPSSINDWIRYGNSKLVNIQTAKALAIRYPSILTVALHPGLCTDTNLGSDRKSVPIIGYLFGKLGDLLSHYVGISTEAGSYNSLFTGISPTLTPEANNGQYFNPVGVETKPSSIASNPKKIQQTWNWTVAQLVERGFLSPDEL